MQKAKTLIWVVVLMFCVSLASCTQGAEVPATEEPAAEEASGEPVTIEWWHISTAEDHKALWQEMADEFMADNPNVTINITVLENEAFKTKLTTVMQSGEPPDIFQSWGGGVMNEYAEAGLLQDITPALDADGGAWRETFSPGPLSVYAYQGKNYGVPWDMGMVGFWYNKQLFADAGIDAPPQTWAELLEDVQALKDSGVIPIALGEGDKWPGHYYWTYLATRIGGQDAFNAASSCSGSFTDEPFVEAGVKLQELIDLEPFQDGYLGATYGDEATLVGDGKAAMELMGQWAPAVEKDNSASGEGLGDNLGFFLFPAVEGGSGELTDAMGGGNGFGIGRDAPPEAIEFVKFLTSKENQIALAEINVGLPVVKGSEEGVSDPNLLMVQEARDKAVYFQLYYDQYLAPATGEVIKDAVQGLFASTLTPEDVAQQLQDSHVAESCQ
ncbi:MAG: extracellular solute-binding protein [Anaerolineae bacterium]|nr:extracellular solute-binding protein [Anaerolineae bacterium]